MFLNQQKEIISFWFYPEHNRFTDENGCIMHDMSDYFDLWELDEWKKTRDYGMLFDKHGNMCELFYPKYE